MDNMIKRIKQGYFEVGSKVCLKNKLINQGIITNVFPRFFTKKSKKHQEEMIEVIFDLNPTKKVIVAPEWLIKIY